MKNKKKLFEYIILGHYNVGTVEKPDWETSLIKSDQLLAEDQKNAQFYIFRSIDQADVDKYGPDNLEIILRPFA